MPCSARILCSIIILNHVSELMQSRAHRKYERVD
jgi:hypothetical protein